MLSRAGLPQTNARCVLWCLQVGMSLGTWVPMDVPKVLQDKDYKEHKDNTISTCVFEGRRNF